MRLFGTNMRLFPHKHKLRIVDCKMERNGHKLYGVICSKCLTIVEAGVTFEQAEMAIRVIRSGKKFLIKEEKTEALSRRLSIPITHLQETKGSMAQ